MKLASSKPPYNWYQFAMVFLSVVAVFFYPFIFAPSLDRPYHLPKLVFLFFITFAILLTYLINILVKRRIMLSSYDLDLPIFFLTASSWLTWLINNTNKAQVLTHDFNSPLLYTFLLLIYYLLSRNQQEFGKIRILDVGNFSAFILAIIAILSFFNVGNLPLFFTPLGSYLDLAIYLGFFSLYGFKDFIIKMMIAIESEKRASIGDTILLLIKISVFICIFATWLLTLYLIIIPNSTNKTFMDFAPWRETWLAFLANIKTSGALIGQGVGGFSNFFPQVRDIAFNYSNLSHINTFNLNSSMLLHTFIELGLIGGGAFVWFILRIIKHSKDKELVMLATIIIIIFLPSSPISLFILIILASSITSERKGHYLIDLKELAPIYVAIAVIVICALIGAAYPIMIETVSSFYAQQSVNTIKQNDFEKAYKLQQKILKINPYREQNQLLLSQYSLNYLIKFLNKKASQKQQLSEQERAQVVTLLDQAIKPAQNAIKLNPRNAQYYKHLAKIYSEVQNLTENSQQFAIENYQQAIKLDPNNPDSYIELGKAYFNKKDYEKTITIFTQALGLNKSLIVAYYFIGRSHQVLKEDQLAKQNLEIALEIAKRTKREQDIKIIKQAIAEVDKNRTDENQN